MKFSIRDVLLVTAIVALAVGWGVDHFRPANYLHRLEMKAEAMQDALQDDGWEVEQEGSIVRIYRKTNSAKDAVSNSSAPAPNSP